MFWVDEARAIAVVLKMQVQQKHNNSKRDIMYELRGDDFRWGFIVILRAGFARRFRDQDAMKLSSPAAGPHLRQKYFRSASGFR